MFLLSNTFGNFVSNVAHVLCNLEIAPIESPATIVVTAVRLLRSLQCYKILYSSTPDNTCAIVMKYFITFTRTFI